MPLGGWVLLWFAALCLAVAVAALVIAALTGR